MSFAPIVSGLDHNLRQKFELSSPSRYQDIDVQSFQGQKDEDVNKDGGRVSCTV